MTERRGVTRGGIKVEGLDDWFDMLVEGKRVEEDSQIYGLNDE